MSTIEEILKAVEQLPPEKLAEFHIRCDELIADLFDAQIERDVAAGKFDAMAEQAIADFKAGRSREI